MAASIASWAGRGDRNMPPDNPLDRRNGLSPDLGDLARQQPAQGSSSKPPPLVMAPGGGVQYRELPPQGLPSAPPTIAGALEHQQRWGSPPAEQQIFDILSKPASLAGSMTAPFKDLTETALQSAPGQVHPEGMGAKAGRAAWMLPSMGAGWEAGVARIINEARLNPERFAGTDIGMFKLVPNKSYYDRYKGTPPPGKGIYYDLIDHNDQKIAELDNVRIDKGGHINVGYYRGPIALGIRQQSLAQNHPAVRLNPGAHGMTTQEQLGMGAALAREFPQQPASPNFAGGFRITGVHSIGDPEQRLPMTEGRRQRAFREAESLPQMPEFEKELFETGLANIREQNAMPPRNTPWAPPRYTPWAPVEPIMEDATIPRPANETSHQAETRRRAMEAPTAAGPALSRQEREEIARPFRELETRNNPRLSPREQRRAPTRPAGDPVQTTIDDLNRLFEDLSQSLNRR